MHFFSNLFARWFKPRRLLPWEPEAERPKPEATAFRRRLGFLVAPPGKLGQELLRDARERLLARIEATTEETPVDERIKLQPHGNAMEFRAFWDGRAWASQPPAIDRSEMWAKSIEPEDDWQGNQAGKGARRADDSDPDCRLIGP